MKLPIISLLLSAGVCSASVSASGGFVLDVKGETNLITPDIGDLYIVVASTNNDSFENIIAGETLTVGSTVGGLDDVVIATGSLVDTGSSNVGAQASFTGVNISTAAEPNPALSAGDHYAFIWFDGVTSTGAVAQGSVYGVARAVNWVIPNDGSSTTASNVTTEQIANFNVQASSVPEPSTSLLLGLGTLALISRRKKN